MHWDTKVAIAEFKPISKLMPKTFTQMLPIPIAAKRFVSPVFPICTKFKNSCKIYEKKANAAGKPMFRMSLSMLRVDLVSWLGLDLEVKSGKFIRYQLILYITEPLFIGIYIYISFLENYVNNKN